MHYTGGNTTEERERDLRCCVYWKMSGQAMVSFLSGESGGAIALRMRSAPDSPDCLWLLSSWFYRSTLAFHSSGGLTQGHATGNSFPLTLSCQVACYESAAAQGVLVRERCRLIHGVRGAKRYSELDFYRSI